MFEKRYSRLKFWIISIVLLFSIAPILVLNKVFENAGKIDELMISGSIGILICIIWINTLANRIRDYGDNPWISLFALIPLANIGLALFYGIAKSNIKEVAPKNDSNSLTSAVYNHSKDIINGIKPAINEYKENHTSLNNNSQNNNINVNESKIYEDIMNEIEQDNKVKSTWAKALSQSDGNKDKAESLYISMRFEELKYQQSYQKEESNVDDEQYENIEKDNKVEIQKDSSSKTIVFLIVLISILVTICIPIFGMIYFNLNKDTSTTINSSVQSNNNSIQNNNNTINEKLSTNDKTEKPNITSKSTLQSIFSYKDWKYESFDNFYRIITNGKVGATGHEFGIIQPKEQCSNNYIWLTFSTISDVSLYIGEKVNFKISIDENVFYQELPIYDVTKVSKSLNIVTFSNFVFNDYSISLLKKGKKIKIEIIETNKLYDMFDNKFEEFSLDGFVANFLKLEEKCNIKSTNQKK